ncbi:hypothetical protein BS47DRAFT_1277224, partial [Hydnum rufescens UP504]
NRVIYPNSVPKASQLHLVLVLYMGNDLNRFRLNLHVLPSTFDAIVTQIEHHPVFHNNSCNPQFPVPWQLAIALYQFGHFGNAAAVQSVAQWAGVSEGLVVKCTCCVMISILAMHDDVICWPSTDEKEAAKCWVESESCARWWNGYCFVDGTLIPLSQKPGFHGNAYFDRKLNYSLNLQLISLPNLRIIDYVIGHTGSAHDSTCFQDSHISKEHESLFSPGEWIWADSAYPVTTWCVPPYQK